MTKIANYYGDWKTSQYQCAKCAWVGQGNALAVGELFAELAEFDCPACGEAMLLVSHPTLAESRANWEKLDDAERHHIEMIERFEERFQREKLHDTVQLPDISVSTFVLSWDFAKDAASDLRTVIKLGDDVIFSEPAVYEGYERFAEVARILKSKYGSRLTDLVPTEQSHLYLYGDRLSSPEFVGNIRRELFS